MPHWLSSLPVLLPALVVTAGWSVVLWRQPHRRWRMALLTASLAVFLFGLAFGLLRYRLFMADITVNHDMEALRQLYPKLAGAMLTLKVSAAGLILHLLLAAWPVGNQQKGGTCHE